MVDDAFPEAQASVEGTLQAILAAAAQKDFDRLESYHLYGPKFSKFEASGPPERLEAEPARRGEREGLGRLLEFRPKVESLKVDVFGSAAVATFLMPYEVRTAQASGSATLRATLVFVQVGAEWKIVHEHLSPVQPRA
jgi:ketosteroid isomerase-like protein